MSTILKALRRLEEDSPKAGAATGSANPSGRLSATDPRATNELRDRILAEEFAAQASTNAQRNPNRVKRIALGTSAVILMWVLGVGLYSILSDEPADPTKTRQIAVATALLPTSESKPAPEPARGRVASPSAAAPEAALEDAVSIRPITRPPITLPVHIAPASVAVSPTASIVAASPKPALIPPPAPTQPSPRATETEPVAATPSTSTKAADEMALAEVTPTAARRAIDSPRAVATPEASPSKPAPPTPRRRPPPPPIPEPRTPSVAAPLPTPIPKEEPGTSRPSRSPMPGQVERVTSLHIPDLTILRTAWHPDPDRRSAKIRLESTNEILNLREGDAVGGLVVQGISPSAVVFKAGEVEIRRRVGQAGSRN